MRPTIVIAFKNEKITIFKVEHFLFVSFFAKNESSCFTHRKYNNKLGCQLNLVVFMG